MAGSARVGSIEVLGTFRSDLIVFISKANQNLDEAADAVRRMRVWLQEDQRVHWEREVRRREVVLNQTRQELLSARMSSLRADLSGQLANVRKAERLLHDATDKVQAVKRWIRDYDHLTEPLLRQIDSFRETIDSDLPSALAFLTQAQDSLEKYAESFSPGSGSSATSSEAGASGEDQTSASSNPLSAPQ